MPVPPEESPDRSDVAAPAAPPQQRSAYSRPTKKNTSLRNTLWALGLTMVVVVVVGIGFFGAGGGVERTTPEDSRLDVAASAERAQEAAAFPVVVPQVGDSWQERAARYTSGEQASWEIDYSSPAGDLITLVEGSEVSASMLSSAMPDAAVTGERSIDGTPCQVLEGETDSGFRHGIACRGEGWGFVVHGAAEPAELEELAAATVAALG